MLFQKNDIKIIKDLYLEEPLQEWNDWNLDFFDREGYQLNKIEKAYHEVNDVFIHTEDRMARRVSENSLDVVLQHWFEQIKPHPNIFIDHAHILHRFGFAGAALDQLINESNIYPKLNKLVFTKPTVIAEGSKTKSVEPFSFSKIQRDIANIDLATGEELPADAQADLDNGLKALDDLKKGKLGIDEGIAKAINDPKNSAAKLQGDAIIGKLTGGVDGNKISVDTIAKKLDTSNLSKLFKR